MKIISFLLLWTLVLCSCNSSCNIKDDSCILSYTINPNNQELKLYWKNNQGENYLNFEKLKNELEKTNQELVFAMNGGMFQKNLSPVGLFIEEGIIKRKINKVKDAEGNFYYQPNGIFILTENNKAIVCKTTDYEDYRNIKYATQSGPMLLIDDDINPIFTQGSKNLNIRNGVGILSDGSALFAISKRKINFYDFALFFKKQGCKNALYLDGFVSECYLPSENLNETKGEFGVIIAETKSKN
jgi:uncharacterized protein YigE (DUF2233 family)|tara:strand:- start:92 stop:817 length:726 start_codon:yes stop_codon:yes gene_type:complete